MQNNRRIYLDYSATTRPLPSVIKVMNQVMKHEFGNSNSVHLRGVQASILIDQAVERIAKVLDCPASSLVMTSGATESNNLAIQGIFKSWRKEFENTPEIIISTIEHPSISAFKKHAKDLGFVVRELSVDNKGFVLIDKLNNLLNKNTALVSIMHVNSEIGTIQDLSLITKQILKFKRSAYQDRNHSWPIFHTDASQAIRFKKYSLRRSHIDLLTFNAHKFYGPKGIGGLFVNPKIINLLNPIFINDYNPVKIRPGTIPTELVVGMSEAIFHVSNEQNDENKRLYKLQTWLLNELQTRDVVLNGPNTNLYHRIPGNLHVTFKNVCHEFLQFQLDSKGISVATKSACIENSGEGSQVLKLLDKQGDISGIRISLGNETTKSSLRIFLRALDNSLAIQKSRQIK